MISRITFFVLVVLTVWVGASAIRIERLNAAAGYYLPRHDEDGKWRVSRENTPRDQLRALIHAIGLRQYLLAPLVIGLAVFDVTRRHSAGRRFFAGCCGVVGFLAWSLALYRGYFSSLG